MIWEDLSYYFLLKRFDQSCDCCSFLIRSITSGRLSNGCIGSRDVR